MKNILLSSLLAATLLQASNQTTTEVSQKQIDKLVQVIQNLNEKVEKLESQSIQEKKQEISSKPTLNYNNLSTIVTDHQEQIDQLYDIVDEVETKTFKDKISISPELRLRADSFTYKDTHKAFKKDLEYEPLISVRFRLNMVTEFNENMRFYARSISSKSTQSHERICTLSPQPQGIVSKLHDTEMVSEFDRAYFDYYFNRQGDIPLIFTAGILPTTGGSSSNLIEGTPRKSVFPSIIFDSNIMGVILSADLSNMLGLNDAYLRFIVGKAYTLDEKHYHFQCNRENIGNLENYGLFFETRLPFLGDKTLFLGGLNLAKDIKAKPRLGNDSLNDKDFEGQVDIVNSYLAEFAAEKDQILGNVLNVSVGIEARKIFQTNTDFFAHFALSDPHPNGNEVDFSGQFGVYNTGEYVKGGLVNKIGYASFIGLRQNFPSFNDATIGVEFNYGSQYWWSVTQGSEDVFNKLANRAHTYEIYAHYPFNRSLDIRLGYMQVNENYVGSGWHFAKDGTPLSKDGIQKNLYLMLNGYF